MALDTFIRRLAARALVGGLPIAAAWCGSSSSLAHTQLLAANTPLTENYGWDGIVVASDSLGSSAAGTSQLVLAEPSSNGPTPAKSALEATSPYAPNSKQPIDQSVGEGTSGNETELAKRVAALEETIRQMKANKAEAPFAAKKDDKAKDKDTAGKKDSATGDKKDKKDETPECVPKKIDTIVKPTFTPTGRIYFDGVTYSDDEATKAFFNTDRDNELGFRSFRLGGKGSLYENLNYLFEVELRGTNAAIAFKDIYAEQQSLPWMGHLRAGHFREPIGIEEESGDLYLTFMEKTPATQAFTPDRNFGVMAWDTLDECQEATWFAGVFRADSPDTPTSTGEWRSDSNDWSFDTRFAWLPYYDEPSNGRYLTHVGTSYSHRHIGGITPTAAYNQNVSYNTLNGLAEFGTRSWVGSQGPIGFGAEANSDEWNQINGEFIQIWGAASVQSEYFQVFMNSGEQYNGGYAFFSYFLTGENRGYKKDFKAFDRVQPLEPFFLTDSCQGLNYGWGAWELAFGYSWVNLDDGHDIVATTPATAANRRRGFNQDVVAALNWYQNPWSRMSFDYELELVDFVDVGVPSSTANIFGVRWQVDW
jgi:phosphate-selective porin OprO/OprP